MKLQPLLPNLLLTGSVAVLVAMPAKADVVKVTGVRLNPTANGLEVILKTASGASPQVNTSSDNQTLLIDLSNAQLNLPEGREFQADNPAQGITSVTVTPLSTNSIRVRVTGTQALPKAEVIPTPDGVVFGITAPKATAEATPAPSTPLPETPQTSPEDQTQPSAPSSATQAPMGEEEIEIVATGEQETGYRVPNATSATRTDTPLRDIPQSVQVIPRQVIEDQQVIQLDEAVRNVSGVTSGGTSGGTESNFVIRGFSQAPILRDGFREFSGYSGFSETANLERVEVLKGPASILYGEIAPGGVINLVTKQPLSKPFYEAELQIGSRNLFRPRIDFSGPLTSDGKLLYRLNAVALNDERFRGFDQSTQQALIAPVLTWKISDRTALTVQLEYFTGKRPLDSALVAFGNKVADIPFNRNLGEPDDTVDEDFLNVGYNLEHRFSNNWTLRNAFRYANRSFLNNGAIPFAFDEAKGIMTNYFGLQDIDTQNYSLQTNLVGKFATGSIEHTLLLGVDLNRSEEKEFTGLNFFSPISLNIFDPVYESVRRPRGYNELPLARNTQVRSDRLGVYVQDQISLADNFKLLAGLRYDTVDQTTTNKPTDFDPTTSERTQNDDAFTPRVGIVYQPTKALSLYGSYSRSFTPTTSTTASGNPLEPERGEGYEVGVKAELLANRLLATLAYFDITKQNVVTADPNNPLASVATGEQQSRGVELDVTGQILPGWNIIAAYAYTDAKVTRDNTIPVGNRLFNAPKHSASLWTTYEIQTGTLRGLGFGIGFNYVGERQGDLENSFKVDSYFLTNAAISYRRNNWRFGINFKNLFDIDYIRATNNTRTSAIEPGEPFSVIGSVSVRF